MSKNAKHIISPGDNISIILKRSKNMDRYGLWSVIKNRIFCIEAYEEKLIEIITKDSIGFNLLIGLTKLTATPTTDIESIEFKKCSSQSKLVAKIQTCAQSQLVGAPGSNFVIALIPLADSKKIQVFFLDLKELKFF